MIYFDQISVCFGKWIFLLETNNQNRTAYVCFKNVPVLIFEVENNSGSFKTNEKLKQVLTFVNRQHKANRYEQKYIKRKYVSNSDEFE